MSCVQQEHLLNSWNRMKRRNTASLLKARFLRLHAKLNTVQTALNSAVQERLSAFPGHLNRQIIQTRYELSRAASRPQMTVTPTPTEVPTLKTRIRDMAEYTDLYLQLLMLKRTEVKSNWVSDCLL